jgi:hypothetical protein
MQARLWYMQTHTRKLWTPAVQILLGVLSWILVPRLLLVTVVDSFARARPAARGLEAESRRLAAEAGRPAFRRWTSALMQSWFVLFCYLFPADLIIMLTFGRRIDLAASTVQCALLSSALVVLTVNGTYLVKQLYFRMVD